MSTSITESWNTHVQLPTRATAKNLDIKLVGKFKPCESCALGKAKQNNISKLPAKQVEYLGERLCLAISSPSTKSIEGKHHWLLVVNNCTDYVWSFCLKERVS